MSGILPTPLLHWVICKVCGSSDKAILSCKHNSWHCERKYRILWRKVSSRKRPVGIRKRIIILRAMLLNFNKKNPPALSIILYKDNGYKYFPKNIIMVVILILTK